MKKSSGGVSHDGQFNQTYTATQWHGKEGPKGPNGGQGCVQVWKDLYAASFLDKQDRTFRQITAT